IVCLGLPGLRRARCSGGRRGAGRACGELVLGPLCAQLDPRRIAAEPDPAVARFAAELVELVVGVERVVVEENGAVGPGPPREAERVRGRRVAQPTWQGYSASVYWPSWISSEASWARAKPEIQSSSSASRSAPSAGSWSG